MFLETQRHKKSLYELSCWHQMTFTRAKNSNKKLIFFFLLLSEIRNMSLVVANDENQKLFFSLMALLQGLLKMFFNF